MSKLRRAARLCLDALLFVALSCLGVTLPRWLAPYRRGFFCNDASLSYPYREATISSLLLVVTVLSVPSFVILMLELLRSLDSRNAAVTQRQQQVTHTGYRLGHRLLQCLSQLGYFLFGMALTLFTLQVGKVSVGRLRPHFYSVCQPQLYDGSNCEDEQNQGRFIEQYRCLGVNSTAYMLEQLVQSFPSGHAALSFYAMVYTAIYVQYALSTRYSKLFKHLLQFCIVLLAWYISLTRISDFWHHWSDVLAGALLGTLFASCVALFVTRMGTMGGRSKPSVKPVAAAPSALAKSVAVAAAATPVLPAYTFGSMSYLQHPQQQYAQSYHNYGYVP